MKVDAYPQLKKAAREIAYDNGMINRTQTEEAYLASLDPVLEAYASYDLVHWDIWLGRLTPDQLVEVTCGEDRSMQELMAQAPTPKISDRCLNDLLNEMFFA